MWPSGYNDENGTKLIPGRNVKQVRIMDEQMARIPKTYFGQPAALPFDVFIRLGTDHFVQVARAGVLSQIHHLRAFESDLVPWFYVHQGDFPRYLDEQVSGAELLAMQDVAPRASLAAVGRALAAVMEIVRIGGVTPVAWTSTVRLAACLDSVMKNQPTAATLLEALGDLDILQVKHALFVSLMAQAIGRECGMFSDLDLQHLTTAGLLHDVGYLRLPDEVLSHPSDDLDDAQRQLFRRHPHEGAQMLRDCAQVPSEVVAMVYEHHENIAGTGYPRALAGEKLQLRSVCLALAERFGELTIGDIMHKDGLSLHAAVNLIATAEGQPYPLSMIQALGRLIKPPS